ncbi:MAG: hypothetical protein Q4Q28_09175, partial [Bacteroidales bacterium]|nr:hypothetical protein [Bacteroidales bacterium]
DRTGMEVNPLVFETSASTDSAIWAFRRCKDTTIFRYFKRFGAFFCDNTVFLWFFCFCRAENL